MATLALQDIFEKNPIRPIEGVIKADDSDHLATEIQEYVVTKDIKGLLERQFIDAYLNPAGEKVNGVWISGFFGSGKSHLLKMLSLVLRNAELKTDAGVIKAGDEFLEKVTGTGLLEAGLRKAVAMPTESILFNIDSKAQVVGKRRDDDAVLSAFLMQFNAHCGYYGGKPYVAQLERDLDELGLWDSFKKNYKDLHGKEWAVGREKIILSQKEFEQAFAKTKGIAVEEAKGVIHRYSKEFTLSIDGFSKLVANYLDKQKKDNGIERLNFFVDEVGQYINDNTKLMTNLQTIAENLFTATKGRAWVFVTSQEAIDKVIGLVTKEQAHDFSKIQARFASKLNLQSSNVDEVIERRLLEKTEAATKALKALYAENETKLKSAYAFSEDSKTVSYKDAEHFARTYPFVPYQFPLFTEVLKQLSTNNAFTGKHSSVGERSMLGVAQQVIKGMITNADSSNADQYQLASFDRMYEGIRSTLRSEVTGTLLFAANKDLSDFEMRVLKVLFLVKWLDQRFTATAANVAILMLDRIDQNIATHKEEITKALDKLERINLIQRNGTVYNFLTDEERNVESQIKDIDVSGAQVVARMQTFVFGEVIPDRKYRYAGNAQTYPVAHWFDGKLSGREQDLVLHVTSQHFVDAGNIDLQKSHTLDKAEIRIVLPESPELEREIRMELKTNAYLERNPLGSADARLEPILRDHGTKNRQRRNDIEARLRSLLQEAKIIVSGKLDKTYSGPPKQRVGEAFNDLIKTIYTDLELLGKNFNYQDELNNLRKPKPSALFEDSSVSQAEQAMIDHLSLMRTSAQRVTLESLFKKFSNRPYGWAQTDTAGLTARLIARHKVELKIDGAELSNADAFERLSKSHKLDTVRVELTDVIDASKVQRLKNLHKDLFSVTLSTQEAKEVRQEFAEALKKHLGEVQTVLAKAEDLPFQEELRGYADKLETYTRKPASEYFDLVREIDDALVEDRQEMYGPIKGFMEGPALRQYKELKAIHVTARPNRTYLTEDFFTDLDNILEHKRPYATGIMTKAEDVVKDTRQRLAEAVEKEREETRAQIQKELDNLQKLEEWGHLSKGKQGHFTDKVQRRISELKDKRTIGDIRLARPSNSPTFYNNLQNDVAGALRDERKAASAAKPFDLSPSDATNHTKDGNGAAPVQAAEPVDGYVPFSELTGGRRNLKTPAEVDAFLAELRVKMLEQIEKRQGISIR